MVVVVAIVIVLGFRVGEYTSCLLPFGTMGLLTFLYRQQPKEPFQKTERRDWAETVLDNPELLLMYAQSSGDVSP